MSCFQGQEDRAVSCRLGIQLGYQGRLVRRRVVVVCVPASAGSTRCDAGWPPAPQGNRTREAVRTMAANSASPRCSNPLMADSIAGCARRRHKRLRSSRSRAALERYPLPGNAFRAARGGPDCRGYESPGRDCTPATPDTPPSLHHRHCHVHISPSHRTLSVKDESLVFDNRRTPSSTGVPALPLETQRVCSSKMEKTFSS